MKDSEWTRDELHCHHRMNARIFSNAKRLLLLPCFPLLLLALQLLASYNIGTFSFLDRTFCHLSEHCHNQQQHIKNEMSASSCQRVGKDHPNVCEIRMLRHRTVVYD